MQPLGLLRHRCTQPLPPSWPPPPTGPPRHHRTLLLPWGALVRFVFGEGNDSDGEALEIVFPDEGDEAERREQTQDLRAQLQAERMVVSQLRDEVQRLAGHAESLQAQLQAERAAVSQIEKEAQVYKKEAAVAQQKIAELKENNSRDRGCGEQDGQGPRH